MSPERARVVVPAVVAGLAGLVVLAAALEGGPGFVPRIGFDEPPPTPDAAPVVPPPRIRAGQPEAVQTIAEVLAAVVALAVAALLILLLLKVLRGRSGRLPSGTPSAPPSTGLAEAVAEEPEAPAVRRGIAAALDALGDARAPGDAVVRAWLGLQQSAEDAGVPRGRSETPTEFAVRVLARTGADEPAVRRLLELYLAARFAGAPVSAAEAAGARAALEALQRSWAGERVP